MNSLRRRVDLGLTAIILTIISYFIYTHWINPSPFYTVEYDPEMQYFQNSLALFKGASYAYIDHPGTPVEVIGTLLLALTRPITRGLDVFFIPYHLEHPELFLTLAHGILTVVSILVIILLAMIANKRLKDSNLLSSLGVGVLYFALLPSLTFKALQWWTHNAFNFPFGTLLFVLVIYRFRGKDPLANLEALFLGILAGILTAVQIYLVAWAIGIFISITAYTYLSQRSWCLTLKTSLLTFLGVGSGFFIAFAPVMHRFRRFYIWMKDLVFHQGRYGRGAEGFSTPGQMMDNLEWLWNRGQVILLVTLLAVVLLLMTMWMRRKKIFVFTNWWAVAAGIFIQLVILMLLIVKHPGQNYLLSIAAALPIQFLLIFEAFVEREGWWERLSRVLGAISILGFFIGAWVSFNVQRSLVAQVNQAEAEIEAVIESYLNSTGKSREDLILLWGYGVPSRCYALRYGNTSTEGAALTSEIDEICPSQWLYDVWGGYVELPFAYEPLSENRDWDLVILPEQYLPLESEKYGEVRISEVQTQGYGNLAFILATDNAQ
jgi:hypothetical protein